ATKKYFGESLVDDHHGWRGLRVCVREGPTVKDWNAHDAEVVRADCVVARGVSLAGREGRSPRDVEGSEGVNGAERQKPRHRSRLHAGQSAHALDGAAVEGRAAVFVGELRGVERDAQCEHAFGRVAGVCVYKADEASDEEARADQEHERERDLCDHERAAHTLARAARSRPSPPPASASSRLSVNSCRMMRTRPAPSAVRIAISFERDAARASRRFATFAHAIKSTKPTAPSRTRSDVRKSPTKSSCRETRRARRRASECGYWAARRPAVAVTSAAACSKETPGLSFATTGNEILLRLFRDAGSTRACSVTK